MICLKNRTFAVSQTTVGARLSLHVCCDLLEKSYFCSIANNLATRALPPRCVVICLKNRTFAVSQTTLRYSLFGRNSCDLLEKSYFCSIANNALAACLPMLVLWFAWKIVLLQYRKQLSIKGDKLQSSCDLLEKSYFCSIANNATRNVRHSLAVVICLKNRTFAVSQTTS